MSRKILVTSALPYANGSIHLGHLVEYIQTDIWVRFQKMQPRDKVDQCWYVCADDTHGTPIMLRAERDGITPEALIEKMHAEHSQDFEGFHVAFDNFYTTHSPETRTFANEIYTRLLEKGLIEEAGRLDLPGRPVSFRTTDTFLRVFGLSSLADLPPVPSDAPADDPTESEG